MLLNHNGQMLARAQTSLSFGTPYSATEKLTWAPPALDNPLTVHITSATRVYRLDPARDYVLVFDETIDQAGGILIAGGRNIVCIGGAINLSRWYTEYDADKGKSNVALTIKGAYSTNAPASATPRTVHIEGLLIDGCLGEAIDIDLQGDTNVTVQLENIRIQGTLVGSYQANHADAVQWWDGPKELRIDMLAVANTMYQGFFMQPWAFGVDTAWSVDIRRCDIHGTSGGYLLWLGDAYSVQDTYLDYNVSKPWPGGVVWINDTQATPATLPAGVMPGLRPGGDKCPPGVTGMGYISPGYIG